MVKFSVAIPTYNSVKYLEETLLSVLNQDFDEEEIEILVVDNCSSDGTADLVERVGKGRVKFFQNESNIGAYGNFNRCVTLAGGEFIHLLNSDDTVNPGFYRAYEQKFREFPEVYLLSSNAAVINERSEVVGMTDTITSLLTPSNSIEAFIYKNDFRTPAIVVRKKAYEVLGGFDTELIFTGDWDMWLRVIRKYQGLHLDQTWCNYRVHSDNETSNLFLSGNDTLDFERLFKKFASLGYPIKQPKYLEFLRVMSANHFKVVYRQRPRNARAVRNLGHVHRRFSSAREHWQLLVRLNYERARGLVKRVVLGR